VIRAKTLNVLDAFVNLITDSISREGNDILIASPERGGANAHYVGVGDNLRLSTDNSASGKRCKLETWDIIFTVRGE